MTSRSVATARRRYHAGRIVAGVEILSASGRWPDVVYRVRHTCCGREADLSQEMLRKRVRNRSELCRSCVSQRATAGRRVEIAVGDQVGGVRILDVVAWDPAAITESIYRVRFDCCGTIGELTRRALLTRVCKGARSCERCRKRNAVEEREGPRAAPGLSDRDVACHLLRVFGYLREGSRAHG